MGARVLRHDRRETTHHHGFFVCLGVVDLLHCVRERTSDNRERHRNKLRGASRVERQLLPLARVEQYVRGSCVCALCQLTKIPQQAVTAATILPRPDSGYLSPYPTVVIVTMHHQTESGILGNRSLLLSCLQFGGEKLSNDVMPY